VVGVVASPSSPAADGFDREDHGDARVVEMQ
jgi:hypothetical protein